MLLFFLVMSDDIEYDYGDDPIEEVVSPAVKKQVVDASSVMEQRDNRDDRGEREDRRREVDRDRREFNNRGPRDHRDNTHRDSNPNRHRHPQPQPALRNVNPEHRFFVLKCEYYNILSQAKRTECWPARPHIAAHLDSVARHRACSITLFFTLERAKCFVGMAWVAGPGRPQGRFTELPIRWLSCKDVGFVDVPELTADVFADEGRMTVRDGVELEWEVGKAVERLFYDDSYGLVRIRRR